MFPVSGVGLFLSSIIVLFALGTWIADAAPPWFSNSLLQQQGGLLPNPSRYFQELRQMLGMLPWFSWPLLPLAGWSLWVRRRQWRQADILWPLFAFVALLFLLLFRFDARETTLIVLLPPLALLATPGALALRRGAANAFDWFSGMAFSVFALLLWLGWSAMIFGWPTRLAQRAVELEPGFVGRFDLFFFGLALAVTLWWVWSLLTLPRSPYRCLTRWSTGLAVVWLLAVSLWLPWIDYGKSYRQLSATVAAHLPEQQMECLAGWHLGEAQRASLAYFERLRLTPLGAAGQTRCRWLLTQGSSRAELTPPGSGWQRVWEGQRPGDRRERFRLYRRGNPP
jgi:4-amino-4-deoxy-L-arabinose transferase-like glycosyltransferase